MLSTGSKMLSNNVFGTINKRVISHELNDALCLCYNVGYDYFGEGKSDATHSISL